VPPAPPTSPASPPPSQHADPGLLAGPERRAELVTASLTVPSWDLSAEQQDDLELLLTGAYAPLTGYLDAAAAAKIRAELRLPDGTPWPAPLQLAVDPSFAATVAPGTDLALRDGEGVLIAVLHVESVGEAGPDSLVALAGRVEGLELPTHHDHPTLRRTVSELRDQLASSGRASVLAFVADRVLHRPDIDRIVAAAGAHRSDGVLLIVSLAVGQALDRGSHQRIRCLQRAADEIQTALGPFLPVVLAALPAAHAGAPPAARAPLMAAIAGRAGAAALLSDGPAAGSPDATGQGAELLITPPARDVHEEVVELLRAGQPVPTELSPAAVVEELRPLYPPRTREGFTVFFTGLSGSGKSTIANALVVRLLSRGESRRVTLLDGDLVRKHLSAGLSFSRADRDTNVRRIGFVAAEVSRAGGIVVCAPIAPYDATRKDVRRMAGGDSGFILVHVDTPLEECERRDRKGLYAKARAGLIPEFTGISDPYEKPADAEVVIDTTSTDVEDAVDLVLDHLRTAGWLPPD
jgi:sulfate adenylyltransferase